MRKRSGRGLLVQTSFHFSLLLLAIPAATMTTSIHKVRTVLVTGATDGIGKHTAKKLAADGHRLLIHGRKESDSRAIIELVEDLKAQGAADVTYLQADLGDLVQVDQLAKTASEVTETIDVLINNAGVFDPPEKSSSQNFDMTWAVNVLAPFRLTRMLLPLVARGKDPRIITTSSISQSSRLPDLSGVGVPEGPYSGAHNAYSLSKLGDYLFTVGLKERLEATGDPSLSGIKCLTMDPGTVNTKMLLAGWGACGIAVSAADNTYKLAAGDEGDQCASGSYSFGGPGSRDAQDPKKIGLLWALLEEQSRCSYDSDLFETGPAYCDV